MGLTINDRLARLTNARPTATRRSVPSSPEPIPPHSRRSFAVAGYPGLSALPGAAAEAARILLREEAASLPPVEDWLFLDTETSGLAGGAGTHVFLTGVGQLRGDSFGIDLYFLHDLAAESELLAAVADRLRDAPVVVTFNGKLFDLPLLETRYRMNRMDPPLTRTVHLDLLFPARLLWRLRFGSARLIALEEGVLGFRREGDVPGEEIPGRYFDYLRTSCAELLLPVLQHNAWDIASLAALTGKMLRATAAPDAAGHDALDLFGLSRLFEKAGRTAEAQRLYEHALAKELPLELEKLARHNLALLYKRERAHERAAAQWRELAASQTDIEAGSLTAYEELAICYEHRLKDLSAAHETTRQALGLLRKLHANPFAETRKLLAWKDRFAKRRRRLERKLGRQHPNQKFSPAQEHDPLRAQSLETLS